MKSTLYIEYTAKVMVPKEVRVERGVRQGDTLSPKIFTLALGELYLKSGSEASHRSGGKLLGELRYGEARLSLALIFVSEVHSYRLQD